jgi:hypothetical protein
VARHLGSVDDCLDEFSDARVGNVFHEDSSSEARVLQLLMPKLACAGRDAAGDSRAPPGDAAGRRRLPRPPRHSTAAVRVQPGPPDAHPLGLGRGRDRGFHVPAAL